MMRKGSSRPSPPGAMSSADEIKFPRPRPPTHEGVLSNWIDRYANQSGIDPGRIRRLLAFEFVMAAFEASAEGGDPWVLIKGGVAMELRLNLQGRATKDVDAMLRAHADPDEIDAAVRAALGRRLLDGHVAFEVRGATPIGETGAVRFDVRVLWKTSPLAKVKLEVSGAEGDAGESWDTVASLNLAGQFGLTGPAEAIPCLPLRFQIAQKLHALTDPREDNDRFRDLVDLLLLDDLDERDDDATLRAACEQVFAARARQPWPPRVRPRDDWASGYRALIDRIDFPIDDLDAAIGAVQLMIERIDAAS